VIEVTRHSPSSAQSLRGLAGFFVLEKIMGHSQPGNAPMYRGTAVEDGVTHGLMNPAASMDECSAVAFKKYDTISALMQRQAARGIPRDDPGHGEVRAGRVAALRRADRMPEVCRVEAGRTDVSRSSATSIITGPNTTSRLTSRRPRKCRRAVKVAHARQIALYVTSNNADARACYVTPKKHTTYQIDNVDAHRNALHQMALRCEAFLALSEDPKFFINITIPDSTAFIGVARRGNSRSSTGKSNSATNGTPLA
jgi:hypothetical protein